MAKRGRPPKKKATVETTGTVAVAPEVEIKEPETVTGEFVSPMDLASLGDGGEVTENGAIKAPKSTRKILKERRAELRFDVWMGVLEECPFTYVHAGGRDFPRTTEKLHRDSDERVVRREKVNGKVVSLTAEDVSFISKEVGKKIIRQAGKSRAIILNIDDPRYGVTDSDKPLGEFVYMQIVGGKNLPYDWRESAPEAMA